MKNKTHEQKVISNFFYKTSKNDINLYPNNQENLDEEDNKVQIIEVTSSTPIKSNKEEALIEKKTKLIQDEVNIQVKDK
jgi:hypothetical protein